MYDRTYSLRLSGLIGSPSFGQENAGKAIAGQAFGFRRLSQSRTRNPSLDPTRKLSGLTAARLAFHLPRSRWHSCHRASSCGGQSMSPLLSDHSRAAPASCRQIATTSCRRFLSRFTNRSWRMVGIQPKRVAASCPPTKKAHLAGGPRKRHRFYSRMCIGWYASETTPFPFVGLL